MVGYTDPCSHCGCKRRRPSLDRMFTWPIDRSSVPAPAAKLARTNAGSIDLSSLAATNDPASDTAAVKPPNPSPPTISFGAARVPEPNESDPGTPSPRQQSPFAPSISIVPPTASGPLAPPEATAPDLPRSPAGELKSNTKKKEEEEEEGDEEQKTEQKLEEEKKRRKTRIRVSGVTGVQISFKCKCGTCQEVVVS